MERIQLPYRLFIITLDFESDRPVSRFPAATLRGGFGYTLRRLVCTTLDVPCAQCLLKHRCAYSLLFETQPPPDAVRMRSYSDIPRPFAFRPDFESNPGRLELLLVGNTISYMPYFIYSLNKMGSKGIGKSKLRFQVRDAVTENETVYPVGENDIKPEIAPDTLLVEPGTPGTGSVDLLFYSPLVVRKKGVFLSSFDTLAFVTTLLRRITNLNAFFGDHLKGIDPQPYIRAAQTVKVEGQLKKIAQKRISTRQKREIDYSGLMGTVRLTGDVGTLMPLLKAGERLGVGKNTVFGYGVYSITKARVP